jgi:hypothetical protein
MSPELIAILVTAAFQSILVVFVGIMVYRLHRQGGNFLDEHLALQDPRVKEKIKEVNALVREELLRR